MNACVVSSRGLSNAAGFSVFQLWFSEGATLAALPKACPRSVAKFFLHVGDVIARRQDTPRTLVQVIEKLVGHVRVAQVFDPRDLLPSSFGEERAESSPIS